MLHEDLRESIALLNSHEVHYLIVGHAGTVHGYPRITADMDFRIRRSAAKLARRAKGLDSIEKPASADGHPSA